MEGRRARDAVKDPPAKQKTTMFDMILIINMSRICSRNRPNRMREINYQPSAPPDPSRLRTPHSQYRTPERRVVPYRSCACGAGGQVRGRYAKRAVNPSTGAAAAEQL